MLEIGLAVFGGVAVVLWWLIRQKIYALESDTKQLREKTDAEAKTLWEKHDEDAKRLQELELDIAKRHYVKDELDNRFERLEASIKTSLEQLGVKLDRLSEALIHKGAGQ